MNYLAALSQQTDGAIKLTLYRGHRRYSTNLTPEQAQQLADRLMSFAASKQSAPFFLLDKGV